MTAFDNPFDPEIRLTDGCSCGHHDSQALHDAAPDPIASSSDVDTLMTRAVETAVMKEMFGPDVNRRAFLRTVGASTALAAI
jgi:nitrate/nitrite transport system substrate-binding protein